MVTALNHEKSARLLVAASIIKMIPPPLVFELGD